MNWNWKEISDGWRRRQNRSHGYHRLIMGENRASCKAGTVIDNKKRRLPKEAAFSYS
jgi:hypothetical protein